MAREDPTGDLGQEPEPPPLGPRALLWFLKGEPEAILALTRARGALALGLLFVLSAALAREYDGEDLLAEPWHLLIPFAASLLPALLLGGLAWLGILRRGLGPRPSFVAFQRAVLCAFWLTAPLAWLYAVPWERLCASPYEAAAWNIRTLGLVALWRVLLAARFIRVLAGARGVGPGVFVMVVSLALVGAALALLPTDVFAIMGGVRLSPQASALQVPALLAAGCVVYTGWLWALAALLVLARREPAWAPPALAPRGRVGPGLYALAGGVVAVFVGVLPVTQPEQRRRTEVERAFAEGRLEEAIAALSRHGPGDYPPHWEPPGWAGADLVDAVDAATRDGVAGWVRARYLARLRAHRFAFAPGWRGDLLTGPALERLAGVLERLPEGRDLARALCADLDHARADAIPGDRPALARLRALAAPPEAPPRDPR
ncbi:MAG: hypothetical protein M9894_02695 [Planctomycetes bacterium]|nr:hypothetical protein [Planctomycetota bacterium]